MDCETVHTHLPAHALGALEPVLAAEVEAHLATCEECARLAAEYRDTASGVTLLAAGQPGRVAAPAGLRARVLAAATEPRAPRPVMSGGTPSTPGARTTWAGWRALPAVAALLIVALGMFAITGRMTSAIAQERMLRQQLEARAGDQEIVLEVVDHPTTVKRVLTPPPGTASTAYGKVYSRPALSHIVAMTGRLPAPPEGQEYQLWLTSEGRTYRAGTLEPTAEGFSLLVLDAGRPGPAIEAAQVTLQAPDAAAPGGVIVLRWPANP